MEAFERGEVRDRLAHCEDVWVYELSSGLVKELAAALRFDDEVSL
jgi:hypothetical protein